MSSQGKKIVFATNNSHKLGEMRRIMGSEWDVKSLSDIGCNEEIAETGTTLEENAEIKARYVKEHYGYDCFADDTGLMVDALDGAPGVYSARYAGGGHDALANMRLLLANLDGKTDRKAHFSTVIALVQGSEVKFFEGSVHGVITETPGGTEGFGYDPIFKPDGFEKTFAQMNADEKNSISHRGRATAQLVKYLRDSKE